MPRQETHIPPLPPQWIGPLPISGHAVNDTVRVPLATYETPLWPSTARGAKVAEHCGGVRCTLIDDRMARSILLEAPDAATASPRCNKSSLRVTNSPPLSQEQVASPACSTCTTKSSVTCFISASNAQLATPPGITW